MFEAEVDYNIDDTQIVAKMNGHVTSVMNRDDNDEYDDGTHMDTQVNMIISGKFC